MGNSKLWWYPDGATSPESIDLGRKLSDLQLEPQRFRQDARAGWGQPVVVDQGGYCLVRIALEKMQTANVASTVRALQTFVDSHLMQGGVFSFVLDSDKAWGSWCRTDPARGDTTISTYGNRFTAYGTPTLANGDEFLIESPNPEYRRERILYTSGSTVLTMASAVIQDYQGSPVFARHADFYPILRLRQDAAYPLVHDRRLHWTLDLDCEEWPGDIAALASTAGSMVNVASGSVIGTTTLDTAASGYSRPKTWQTYTIGDPGQIISSPKVTK